MLDWRLFQRLYVSLSLVFFLSGIIAKSFLPGGALCYCLRIHVDESWRMPVTYNSALRRPYYPGHNSSYLELIPEEELEAFSRLEEFGALSTISPAGPMSSDLDQMAAAKEEELQPLLDGSNHIRVDGDLLGAGNDYLSAQGSLSGLNTPGTPSTPGMSRTNSSTDMFGNFESFGHESFPPVDRLTVFDILENLALPQRLEKMQNTLHDNAEKLRRQRQRLASRARSGKNNIVEEWRKRVHVAPEEQLDKYRRRMRRSVERMSKRWNDAKTVTLAEKISFVTAVLNIFISAYLIGAWPEYFHYWYTAQLA